MSVSPPSEGRWSPEKVTAVRPTLLPEEEEYLRRQAEELNRPLTNKERALMDGRYAINERGPS